MTTNPKREALKAAYSGPQWQARVAKMSDSQVIAIYLKLKEQGKVS